jgi:transposase
MHTKEKAAILISRGFEPIPDLHGYWCNKEGEIASSANREKSQPRILCPLIINSGYKTVHVEVEGKGKRFTVHKLVALTFIQNPHGYSCIDHLDSDKLNNCADNLEWVTQKENIRRCIEKGRFPSKKGELGSKAKLTEDQVKEIYQRMSRGESTANLANEFGVKYNAIKAIYSGVNWSHLGLIPRFKGKAIGENVGNAKLTDNQADEIKLLLSNGIKVPEIAKRFNVSKSCIQHIKMGRCRK